MVRHAEPAVCRVQHGYLQPSLLQQVSHHARQQALRLDVVPGLAAQEVVKVGLQLLKDGGHEAPEVHGHHRVRRQLPVLPLCHISDGAVREQLDLQRLMDAAEPAVLHPAHATGHGAVGADGVFQQIPHHGGPSLPGQALKLLIHGPVGIHAVVVVGVDDAEGLGEIGPGAQHRMGGAEGLGAARRNGVVVRYAGEVLHGVADLQRLSCFCYECAVPPQAIHQLPHIGLDDEHHLGKARPNGIVDGILHQHLPLRSYAVHLFISTVAGTQSRRHNDQCCLHGDPPEIRRLHSAGAAACFSVTARGRFDDYTTLPPPLQPFPPGNPRITKSSHPPHSP